jgi:hypothetical protein
MSQACEMIGYSECWTGCARGARRRGFVLRRDMPVEDRPIAESAAAYSIGTYFGSARSRSAPGHLLGYGLRQRAQRD